MTRTSIELITGHTKAGKPQTKKYFAKPTLSLFDTIQGSKLASKFSEVFRKPDYDELTEEEFEKLSETEKREHQAKIEEHENLISKQFDALDEISVFVAESFDNQFTPEEFLKGIPAGAEGFNTLKNVLEKLISGEVDDTKKFVNEKKK